MVRIDRHVSREDAVALYAHAAVFCCPSVYEPFGLINLEAMACETPVVASRVGGIPDVVVDGETGILVGFEPAGDGSGEPADPAAFHDALARALSALLADPSRRDAMGRAGRRHVRARFGWDVVAAQVIEVYGEAARRRRASS